MHREFELVGIVASAGGPAALQSLLGQVGSNFPCPLLVVQHMASGFVSEFAEWLQTAIPLRVCIATDGEQPQPGRVYLAPEDVHLTVVDGRIRLTRDPPDQGFRPSGTVLFNSLARYHPAATVGIILTGMGTDGVAGLKALFAAGGHVMAQDESTCVVFGMPQAAIAAGVVHHVVPLPQMPDYLHMICG